eukprot:7718367-Karenia_brevis.AAC.1
MTWKLVSLGNTNLGGIEKSSWGAHAQMMHTSGDIEILDDHRNNCKWVMGAKCSWNANPDNVQP